MTQQDDSGSVAQRMFGAQAPQYAQSQVHAGDHRLDVVQRFAPPAGNEWVIDLGTGTGFTAFAIAANARRVVASDLTLPMLRETRRIGQERQLSNIMPLQNRAEACLLHPIPLT